MSNQSEPGSGMCLGSLVSGVLCCAFSTCHSSSSSVWISVESGGKLPEGKVSGGEACVQMSLLPLRANIETHASVLFRWCSKKVRDLWWQGIPPSVRGKVWSLAIGNELNITHGEWLV